MTSPAPQPTVRPAAAGDPLGIGAPPAASGTPSGGGPSYIGLPPGAVVTVADGNDLGRGPGGPGGGQVNRAPGPGGMPANEQVAPWGSGGGYTEEDVPGLLAAMPPEQLARVQRQMVAAGLIGPQTKYTYGQPDNVTRSAFAELLGMANLRGVPWQTQLDAVGRLGADEARAQAQQLSERQRAELNLRTRAEQFVASDPASVRQLAEAAFKTALGRKPNDDEVGKFVSTFLSSERGNFDAQVAGRDAAAGFERDQDLAAADRADAVSTLASGGSESDVLWQRINQMIADSPYADQIKPGKRSRSYEEQVALYEKYKRGGPLAAKPGTSKHGDGRANDLKYGSDAARQWVLANAKRYGLALPLYDPKKKRSHNESWHVELADGHSMGDGHDHGGSSGGTPPLSRTFSTQGIDPAARATEQIRRDNPVEVGAYDIGTQFQSFVDILSRSVA